jgi:hypothetical protein
MIDRQTRRHDAGGFFISIACRTLLAAAALAAGISCDGERPANPAKETMQPGRPISTVLEERAPGLLALEGVAGVYEGATPDGKPCIVVMLKDERPVVRKDIPASLDGYPVRLEFGGEIRPMR